MSIGSQGSGGSLALGSDNVYGKEIRLCASDEKMAIAVTKILMLAELSMCSHRGEPGGSDQYLVEETRD